MNAHTRRAVAYIVRAASAREKKSLSIMEAQSRTANTDGPGVERKKGHRVL
jgi:hypothetical protein